MRRYHLVGSLSLALIAIGCGTTIHPHVTAGGTDRPPGLAPGGGRLNPRPVPEAGVVNEASPVFAQVCRIEASRPGWIAIRYVQGVDDCPKMTDAEQTYTAAVIERYTHKVVGATMVVCADQPVPREWVQERNQDVRDSCPGARVREGRPTVMVIRRISDEPERRR